MRTNFKLFNVFYVKFEIEASEHAYYDVIARINLTRYITSKFYLNFKIDIKFIFSKTFTFSILIDL
jgi:hypothetical protein